MAPRHVAVWSALVKHAVLASLCITTASAAACGPPTLEVGTPFTVISVGPSHGATAIAVDTDVRVGFNEPLSRESAAANTSLSIDGAEVERSTLFLDGDSLLVLIPVRTLPAATLVTLTIAAELESAAGVDLDSSLVVEFTTE